MDYLTSRQESSKSGPGTGLPWLYIESSMKFPIFLGAPTQESSKKSWWNIRLQNEINNLRKGAKVGNNGPKQAFDNDLGYNRRGRGGRGGNSRGRGSGSYSNQPRDEAFFQARLKLCLKYNLGQCDDATQCGLNHACNRKVAPGTVCGHAHRGREHQ